jgi:hypothetical protein
MGARISRDSIIYSAVTMSVFPLALVNAAVLTHFLSTTAFGQLAILFFWSGMLTVGLNLFILRGTERHVWGSSEDGMDTASTDPLVDPERMPAALGTGLLLNMLIAGTAFTLVFFNARSISQLLVHTTTMTTAVKWGGAAGALGSVWRLGTGILRWERRRRSFSVVYIMRWVAALAISWPLLILGLGPPGVMAATAIGTAISLVVGLTLARKSFRLGFVSEHARKIFYKDVALMAMVVGLTILHDSDVFLLSLVSSASSVGLYRLATRMTSFVSYAVSAFLLAWAPLEASPLFRATYTAHTRPVVRRFMMTYYLITGTFLVVLFAVAARPTIGIVAPHYGGTVKFVAITATAYLAYGMFLVSARTSVVPHRYIVYGASALTGGAAMIGTCLLLGPVLGGFGVAIGDLVGALVGFTLMAIAGALSHEPSPIDRWRAPAVLLTGALCYLVGVPLAHHAGPFEPLLQIGVILAYPVILLVTGVIPKSHRAHIKEVFGLNLRSRRRQASELIAGIFRLPVARRRILIALLRDHRPVSEVARKAGLAQPRLGVELVAGLRQLTGLGPSVPLDDGIGALLLASDSVTAKNSMERRLEREGVKPTELHGLVSTFELLRSASPRLWPLATRRELATETDVARAVGRIDPVVKELVEGVVRRGDSRYLIGGLLPRDDDDHEVDHTLIGVLRELGGLPLRPSTDCLIASFLFDGDAGPPARQLWAAGVDPIELHELEVVIAQIRSIPEELWRRDGRVAEKRPVVPAIAMPLGDAVFNVAAASAPSGATMPPNGSDGAAANGSATKTPDDSASPVTAVS